jgi:hypothetical protein
MRIRPFIIIVVAAVAAFAFACGSNSSPKKPDAHPDSPPSACGNPGDVGNDMGVGKYCANLSDCSGNGTATLCSSLGDPTTHFCTRTCTGSGSAGNAMCGSNASCTCNSSNQCGCTPNKCL